jgi:hypothetical protein
MFTANLARADYDFKGIKITKSENGLQRRFLPALAGVQSLWPLASKTSDLPLSSHPLKRKK